MTKASLRSHWEAFWERSRQEGVGEVYSNAGRVHRNLRRITELRGKRVLEIGAGTGRDSFPLAAEGARVVQLDYAENSLSILREEAKGYGVEAAPVRGDAFHLPFRDGVFDIVFHQGLLEHFPSTDAEALLCENARVVREGGLFLIDVPQRYHCYTLIKHLLIALGRWFAGWEREFSIGELARSAEKCGMKVEQRYGEWMYPSLLYRTFREALKKGGVKLPLYPRVPLLTDIRSAIRLRLLRTSLPLYTGISIGVVGRKPQRATVKAKGAVS